MITIKRLENNNFLCVACEAELSKCPSVNITFGFPPQRGIILCASCLEGLVDSIKLAQVRS